MDIKFSDRLKIWSGEGGWHYVLLPKNTYEDIRLVGSQFKRGFGSIRVSASTGNTTWNTSIFPDTQSKQYILFIKKDVRKSEKLEVDQKLSISLQLENI